MLEVDSPVWQDQVRLMRQTVTSTVRAVFLKPPYALRESNLIYIQREMFLKRVTCCEAYISYRPALLMCPQSSRCRKMQGQEFAMEAQAFQHLSAEQREILDSAKASLIKKIKKSWEYYNRQLNNAVFRFLAPLPATFPVATVILSGANFLVHHLGPLYRRRLWNSYPSLRAASWLLHSNRTWWTKNT